MNDAGFTPSRLQADQQDPESRSARNVTVAVYALQAASFVFGLTFVVGVILNYAKRGDVLGTWLESHFRWQIRTFWFGLLWGVLGVLLSFVLIGYLVLIANAIWIIYRIAKGWLNLVDAKTMYATA